MAKKDNSDEQSREFKERSKLIEMQREVDQTKHNFKMEELEFERATHKLIHDQILERGRIERAETRKVFLEKQKYYKDNIRRQNP